MKEQLLQTVNKSEQYTLAVLEAMAERGLVLNLPVPDGIFQNK